MGLLAQVISGPKRVPYYLLIYGKEDCGKSSLAASFPKPICIDVEFNADFIGVDRVQFDGIGKVLNFLDELATEEHPFETVIIDTLDTLVRLLEQYIKQHKFKNSDAQFNDFAAGAKTVARAFDREVLGRLNRLHQQRGMNVVLVGHASPVKEQQLHKDEEFVQWMPRLDSRCSDIVRERVQQGFFVERKVTIEKKSKWAKAKGFFGETIIYTQAGERYWAKNKLGLPAEVVYRRGMGFDEIDALRSVNNLSHKSEFDAVLKTMDADAAFKVRQYVKNKFHDENEGMRWWLEQRKVRQEIENAEAEGTAEGQGD